MNLYHNIPDEITWYKNQVVQRKILSRAEEVEFITKAQQGDKEASDFMIENNLSLVMAIVDKYCRKESDYLDLVQEGNLGLIKAINKFDSTKNTSFSTYAYHWIRQSVARAIQEQFKTINVPVPVYEDYNKCIEVEQKLTAQLQRMPTLDEISKASNFSINYINHIKKSMKSIESLNKNAYTNNITEELIDLIPNKSSIPDQLIKNDFKKDISYVINECNLDNRKKEMIKLYYGIDGYPKTKQGEIGKKYNQSSKTVSGNIKRGLQEIRRSKHMNILAEYLPESNLGNEILNKEQQKNLIKRK